MRAITTEINRVAAEAINAARDEARFDDRVVTLGDFHAEVAVLVAQSTIENSPMLGGAIERAAQSIAPEFFAFVRPAMGMDENGDYTSDKLKWA
tara:strand:- start:22525 stop:22806 length:282 start_codon:yes stop_codon:yes gene_type:complete